jgi:cytochrome c553
MRRVSFVATTLAFATSLAVTPGARTIASGATDARESRAPAANDTIATYCVPCHNDRRKSGAVSFSQFDATAPGNDLDVAERAIRRLRAGMMPPAGANRPDPDVLSALATTIETAVDTQAAARAPDPGQRPFQRLNRAEYARAIRDLVGLEIDAATLLPADTISGGFDNVADVQTFSPTLVTSYLQAARRISAEAVARPSNTLVFACRPRRATDEPACAARIVNGLATRAYRGMGTAEDLQDAMSFYARGRSQGDFGDGVRLALQSILVSPRFLFRLEPLAAAAGVQPVSDMALASRLSFFLWGRSPDEELLAAARRGLRRPGVYDAQVRRLLADNRSSALSSRFARQWLRLQDLDAVTPDRTLYPRFDKALATAMLTETDLFFDSIVRDDRNVLELLTADYSFVNQRLAQHYGLARAPAAGFARVQVPESRRGLLGHGSILMATSLASRTSPVLRGKWILEVLLGTPPPPPPPNVPALDDSAAAVRNGVRFSTRQRIEQHRRSPQCSSCHRVIDPLGLTLENFDVTGAWRGAEDGVAIDARGELFDGAAMDGPEGLRRALLQRQDLLLRTFAENLLTYATGRRLTVRDMPLVRAIVTNAAADNFRFSAFVKGVTTSAPFTMAAAVRE